MKTLFVVSMDIKSSGVDDICPNAQAAEQKKSELLQWLKGHKVNGTVVVSITEVCEEDFNSFLQEPILFFDNINSYKLSVVESVKYSLASE